MASAFNGMAVSMKPPLCVTALALSLLVGCWTFNETEFPAGMAVVTKPPSAPTLHLTGFETLLTEYDAVQGFQTVYVPGHYDYYYGTPGYFATVPTTTYVAQRRSSDMFLRRAVDAFEKAGWTIAPANADFAVDLAFEGPYEDSSDSTKELLWKVCTLFFCDYGAVTWNAKLRVREAKTGKLVFSRDYSQRYETNAAGIIPLFGISHCQATKRGSMQLWCQAALTDQAVADAAAFLVK